MGSPALLAEPFVALVTLAALAGSSRGAGVTAGAGGGDSWVTGDDGDVPAAVSTAVSSDAPRRGGDGSEVWEPNSSPARRCASATVCSTRRRSIGAPNANATCPRLRAVVTR